MEWEDDEDDRSPMTEAIDTIKALRAELAECKQEIIDRHNAEENLKQSWIDLDDETKALRSRIAELEQANADLNKQLITAWALVQEHQMYQAKQGKK